MQTKTKRLSITLLILALCMCLVCGLAMTVSSAKADTTTLTLDSFKTTAGASISTSGPLGMKFQATISKTDYDKVIDVDENAEFGMAIARGTVSSVKDFTDYASQNSDKVHHKNETWEVGHAPTDENVQTVSYTFIINNIDADNYAKNYVAVAYAKVNGEYYYSKAEDTAITRSPLIVAINYVCSEQANVDKENDKFAYEIISDEQPTLVLDKEGYVVGDKPVVKVNNVVVYPKLESNNTSVFEVENGAIVAKTLGTATLTAKVEGWGTDVFSVEENVAINPVISKSGILTTYTNGEETTVKVNDGTSDIITETVSTETFDLYDAIISYRENKNITDNKSYTVSVESATYKNYSVETAIITAINSVETFKTATQDSTDSGKYYYLTSDIALDRTPVYNIGSYVNYLLGTSSGVATCLNLDGRGYKLSFVDANSGACRTLFELIKDSYIKNLNIVYDFDYNFSTVGTIAYQVVNSTFENCYFDVTESVTMANAQDGQKYNQSAIKWGANSNFVNCVFELNDKDIEDAYKLVVAGHDSRVGKFTNCAILTNDTTLTAEDLLSNKTGLTTVDFDVYNDVQDLIAGEKDVDAWKPVWEFNSNLSLIKLCGASVYEIPKDAAIEGTPTVDGIVTFKTGVSGLKIDLYSAAKKHIVTLEENYTGTTFDLYTAIADYRINNGVTTNESYIAKFESASARSELATATIGAISDLATLRAAVDRANEDTDNMYYYLSADVELLETGAGMGEGLTAFATGVNNNNSANKAYLNLDGRGYALKMNVVKTGSGDRLMFDQIVNSNIKNLVVDYNVQLAIIRKGTFAYQILNSKFDNCYFQLTMKCEYANEKSIKHFTQIAEGSTFNNCVFNIVDNSSDKNYPVHLVNSTTKAYFNNCAVSYNDYNNQAGLEQLFGNYNTTYIPDINPYSTIDSLVNAESADDTWNDNLKITSEGIILCGKTIADVTAMVEDT